MEGVNRYMLRDADWIEFGNEFLSAARWLRERALERELGVLREMHADENISPTNAARLEELEAWNKSRIRPENFSPQPTMRCD